MAFNTEEILKAIQIISQSEINGLKLDKTITAQISSIVNLETGEYKVEYEGNTFSAFSAIATTTYEVGNSVYVKIPQNDMSNRKVIEGLASGEKTITDIVEQQTAINQVGPTWDKFYGYAASDTFGIVCGVAETHRNYFRQIYPIEGSAAEYGDAAFQNYARSYNKIRISASFQTRFMAQHIKGNYGLIVGFRVNTVDDTGVDKVYYKLDMSNFVGSPYNYTTWSPQSVIIDVQDNYLLGLDSIILFQDGFDLDTSRNYSGDIIYQNDGDDDNFNILVKDIQLSFVELVDLTQTTYYLDVSTPQGISFITSADTLSLVGKLWHQGTDIMSSKTCDCYWYKENPEVMIGHEKYDKSAGPGWELIEGDFNTLYVKATEVLFETTYKLIVIYSDQITLTKEVTLYRFNSNYDYQLVQETDGSTISLKIQNNKDDGVLVGDWYFSLPDGSYNLVTNGEKQSAIIINDYLVYTVIEFYCQVYDGDTPISVESITIKSSSQSSDVEVTYDGQDVFQYDANGDLAFEDTEVDRTLAAQVTWQEGFGSAYKLIWLIGDEEISSNRLSPTFDSTNITETTNSMMQNLWVDNYNILHYNIRQKYAVNYTNNIVTIKITTVNGYEYYFEKEILFLKDGDQGTNGTTYICAIRPVNIANGYKLTTNSALSYNGSWGSGINLRCFVYRDGDLINDSGAYSIQYDWEVNDTALSLNKITGLTNKEDYRVVNGIGSLDEAATHYLVKVTITVKTEMSADISRWDDDTMIYCQYPIDIAVNGLDVSTLEIDLPSYIKYTAAGTDPSYQKTTLVCNKGTTSAVFSSTNSGLFEFKANSDDTGYVLNPTDKFLYREGIAAIKCAFDSQYLLHPVMMYLDTYGNETINGWDGTALEIDEAGQYILAPQVGAGRKNSDGTFTGVLMGRQSGIEDNDVFGLYGYQKGVSTFGFKEDGTAYIGAAGAGQIIFDGTKNGIIKSGNYDGEVYDSDGNLVISTSGAQGMKIELTTGHIDAYNFRISSGNMTLDSAKQQFLFKIGDSTASYFRICSTNETTKKTLFNVQADSYYLQTEDFVAETTGVVGQGTKIDLAKGKITSYDFTIKTPALTITSSSSDASFSFDINKVDSSGGGRFQIKYGDTNLFYLTPNSYYLQSYNYVNNNSDENADEGDLDKITGMKINLQTGKIWAKNVELSGRVSATSGKIGDWIISGGILRNSDNTVYLGPTGFRFGDYFSVSTNGISIKYDKENDLNTVITNIKQNAEGIKLSVSGTTTTFTDYNGKIYTGDVDCYQKSETYTISETQSAIQLGIKGISLSTSTDGNTATIKLYNGDILLSSNNITFSGFVTFAGLEAGTTKINGGCIQTGTISADYIDVETIKTIGNNKHDISILASAYTLTLSGGTVVISAGDLQLKGGDVDVSSHFYLSSGTTATFRSGSTVEILGNVYIGSQTLESYIKSFIPTSSSSSSS